MVRPKTDYYPQDYPVEPMGLYREEPLLYTLSKGPVEYAQATGVSHSSSEVGDFPPGLRTSSERGTPDVPVFTLLLLLVPQQQYVRKKNQAAVERLPRSFCFLIYTSLFFSPTNCLVLRAHAVYNNNCTSSTVITHC